MSKKKTTKTPLKEHLNNFHIAGFTYYDGPKAFSSLKIGDELKLALDPDNRFDARAVAIYFKDWKLGFVPRSENRMIYKFLRTNTTNFEARIQQIDGTEHPEAQVRVVVHLVCPLDPPKGGKASKGKK